MKKYILFLSFLQLHTLAYAQVSAKPASKNMIILNPGKVLSNLIYSTNQVIVNDQLYLLSYRRLLNEKNAIRFGVNIDKQNAQGFQNDTLRSKVLNNQLMLGIGVEHYRPITKAWSFFYGADFTYGKDQDNYKYDYYSQFSNIKSRDNSQRTNILGAFPFAGCFVSLNNRIGLGIETGFHYSYKSIQTTQVTEYYIQPQNTILQSSIINTIDFKDPTISFRVRL